MKSPRAAFTLVELLVVIGLIAVLSGVLGLALGRGNSGAALQSAQSTASALVAGARAQAATSFSDAGLFVNVTPASDGFLSEFYIATWNGTEWIARGDPSRLPSSIYLVPENSAFPGNVSFDGDTPWSNERRSAAFVAGARQLKATNGTTDIGPDSYRLVARFNPRGSTNTTDTLRRLVFAAAQRSDATTLRFDNADALRGMTISNYGIPTLIHEAAAFN
jgi:prepilin-type N-terminal cleavage/methylation domain-containing protein